MHLNLLQKFADPDGDLHDTVKFSLAGNSIEIA